MLSKLIGKLPPSAWATGSQVAGAAGVATGVGLLAGLAWAIVTGGAAALLFGIAAEAR